MGISTLFTKPDLTVTGDLSRIFVFGQMDRIWKLLKWKLYLLSGLHRVLSSSGHVCLLARQRQAVLSVYLSCWRFSLDKCVGFLVWLCK